MSDHMNLRVPGIGLAPHRSVAHPRRSSLADLVFDARSPSRTAPEREFVGPTNSVPRPHASGLSHGGTHATTSCAEA